MKVEKKVEMQMEMMMQVVEKKELEVEMEMEMWKLWHLLKRRHLRLCHLIGQKGWRVRGDSYIRRPCARGMTGR